METEAGSLAQVKPEPSYASPETADDTMLLERQAEQGTTQPSEAPTLSSEVVQNLGDSGQPEKDADGEEEEVPLDNESAKGIFGWETVDNTSIPYLLRKGKKFVSVRIVERKLLSKYPNTFPDELGEKDPLVSHFITEAESKLLNEINTEHCAFEYGQNPFTTTDLIVDLEEFEEFFKVVKKTFPAEVLAKMGGEVIQHVPPPPVIKSELSQMCGWLQINNTVSPYIMRFDGSKRTQLVPLSVILYAAGLLNNTNVEGILPTPQECAMLNEACKVAGFDFSFGKNTRLIAMSEVMQHCPVRLIELPLKNPLQHARYIDAQSGQLPSNNNSHAMLNSMSHQPMMAPTQPPSPHGRQPFPGSDLGGDINPFMAQYARHPAFPPPPHLMMQGSVSAAQSSQVQNTMLPSSAHLTSLNMDQIRPPPMLPENKVLEAIALQRPKWGVMPQLPQPAHAGSNIPQTQTVAGDPSSAGFSGNPGLPDLNHPIFRARMGMPVRGPAGQPLVRFPAPNNPALPQYSAPPSSLSFGVNQFNSSLFARTDLQQPNTVNSSSSGPVPRRHSGESLNNINNTSSVGNNKTRRPSHDNHAAMNKSQQKQKNSVNHKSNLRNQILACLVNGKSISCIHIDGPTKKGRFCLVEAVSKLYFPGVPLQEFLKVLNSVLGIKLLDCTPQEEAAFVEYYNLPVNRLKCNKVIAVGDLDKFFPQLSYMFGKGQGSGTKVNNPSNTTPAGQKRSRSPPHGPPPLKQSEPPRLENVVQMLQQHDKLLNTESSNRPGAPVIVIDD